jgi:NAD(P)H dehydrogenase (quinone)
MWLAVGQIGDGSRLPTENELQGARNQGRKIAETVNKLHG